MASLGAKSFSSSDPLAVLKRSSLPATELARYQVGLGVRGCRVTPGVKARFLLFQAWRNLLKGLISGEAQTLTGRRVLAVLDQSVGSQAAGREAEATICRDSAPPAPSIVPLVPSHLEVFP